MLKFAPYPSYFLNLLNLFDLLFDSSLSPIIPLILDFLCLIFFCFVILLPLVGGIPWNIGSGPTSVGSLSFIFQKKFQVVLKFVLILKLWGV